jgi:putative transposase
MTEKRWTVSNTSVFNINYHIIWTTKYRLKLLSDGVDVRLKELIYGKTDSIGCSLKSIEVMPDHVHIFVSSTPNIAPHYIVQQIKGYTSRILRKEFEFIKTRTPSLWTRSYYCESVGAISENTVKRYIENQKARNA